MRFLNACVWLFIVVYVQTFYLFTKRVLSHLVPRGLMDFSDRSALEEKRTGGGVLVNDYRTSSPLVPPVLKSKRTYSKKADKTKVPRLPRVCLFVVHVRV